MFGLSKLKGLLDPEQRNTVVLSSGFGLLGLKETFEGCKTLRD